MKRSAVCRSLLCLAALGAALALPAAAQDSQPAKAGAAAPATQPADAGPSLSIGDVAPKLAVEKFIKGDALTGFEKGRIYVVEFWATWCGPCVRAFPHLSDVQAKYKDKGVTIIGVNIWEGNDDGGYSPDTLEKVTKFVEKQAEKMAYTVAYDGAAKKMDDSFMKAAGQRGIPACFIVDKEGRIAWMGHPMEMDKPLEGIVAGSWDIEKSKKEMAAQRDREKRERELMKKSQPVQMKIMEAVQAEKWDDAIAAMDELKKMDAEVFGRVDLNKFMILLTAAKQYDKAYAMKDALLANKQVAEQPDTLNMVAWAVVDPEGEVEKPDLDFAMTFAGKANEMTKGENPAILDTLARIHWLKGDKAKAVEMQEKAIKACGASEEEQEMKSQMEETLKEYQEKAAPEKK